jgi:osmotically-inducible protein OsmY
MAPRTELPPPDTDADVFYNVRHALDHQLTIPATVRVHVYRGEVTLTGTVRRASESAAAEASSRRARGVTKAINHISVSEPPSALGVEPPRQD